MAEQLRSMLSHDLSQHLDTDLYNRISSFHEQRVPLQEKQVTPKVEIAPKVEVQPTIKEEKPEIEAPVMTLYDLFGFSEEERTALEKGGKKKAMKNVIR